MQNWHPEVFEDKFQNLKFQHKYVVLLYWGCSFDFSREHRNHPSAVQVAPTIAMWAKVGGGVLEYQHSSLSIYVCSTNSTNLSPTRYLP